MKRIVVLVIFAILFSAPLASAMAEEEQDLLTVEVHADGSFTVTTGILPKEEWATREYNSVVVYSKEDNGDGTMPILWWVPIADGVTIIQYPGAEIRYPNRDAPEFVDGPGSALRPGTYYIDLSGYHGMIAGPLEFEIPEILATPTPLPTPTEEPTQPPATPTPVPTASPTAKAPPTPTTDRTATPTVAVTPPAAAGSERSGTHTVLWICIGAAAVLAAGIVTVILVRKKK